MSTLPTMPAWLERAERRTVKHLEEEVRATELLQRTLQQRDMPPPDAELLEMIHGLERQVLSGRFYEQALAKDASERGDMKEAQEEAGQMSAQAGQMSRHAGQMSAPAEPPDPGTGTRTLRLRVTDETFCAYRALDDDYRRRTNCPLGFLAFLCRSVWDSWHDAYQRDVAYAGIYARDRYRCQSPVCNRPDVTPHHLLFRSRGGDDSAENVISLCVWCHLEGVHNARIRAAPPASEVRWSLGERPLLEVHGRELLSKVHREVELFEASL